MSIRDKTTIRHVNNNKEIHSSITFAPSAKELQKYPFAISKPNRTNLQQVTRISQNPLIGFFMNVNQPPSAPTKKRLSLSHHQNVLKIDKQDQDPLQEMPPNSRTTMPAPSLLPTKKGKVEEERNLSLNQQLSTATQIHSIH